MPISVGMLIEKFFPLVGGAEKQLQSLAPCLREQGVEIKVLTRQLPGANALEDVDGIPVYRIPHWGPSAAAHSLSFTLNCLIFLSRHRDEFNLLHAHNIFSSTTTAVLAGQLWSWPVVTKILGGGSHGELARMQRKLLGRQRLQYFSKHIDAFVGVSEEIREELITQGVDPAKTHCIPNGVDTTRFRPATAREKVELRKRLRLPQGSLVIFVGRLEPVKNLDLLLTAWSKIKQGHLLLLGDGTLRPSLEQMVRDYGLSDRINFLGIVKDVTRYLQASDCFVLPSASEGLSNALLEAMACGLPVVASAVGGSLDLIVDRENGLLVTPGNGQELTEAIECVLINTSWAEQLGRFARQTIEGGYSLDMTSQRLRELYMSLLGKN